MDDLFGHLLEYLKTEEYKELAATQKKKERDIGRPFVRKASKIYRMRHPEFIKMRSQAAKFKGQLYDQQHGLCRWCNEPLADDYEVDHITALINGGTNDLINLCVCHQHCNRKKFSKPIVQLSLF